MSVYVYGLSNKEHISTSMALGASLLLVSVPISCVIAMSCITGQVVSLLHIDGVFTSTHTCDERPAVVAQQPTMKGGVADHACIYYRHGRLRPLLFNPRAYTCNDSPQRFLDHCGGRYAILVWRLLCTNKDAIPYLLGRELPLLTPTELVGNRLPCLAM